MPEHGDERSAPGWDWVLSGGIEIGGCLMFARGASPDRVIEAFGMDPTAAQVLPASRAYTALRLPVWDDTARTIHPWVRAGRSGEWAFAIDQSALDIVGYHSRIARALSAGTDLVMFEWTQTIDYFHYLVDGTEVTSFEPLRAWDRSGTEPDRFLREMRQSGLSADPLAGTTSVDRDPRIALLEMLTLTLGIRLPADIALGPLLTVQRTDQVSPDSWSGN
jgi:hypothetical protein